MPAPRTRTSNRAPVLRLTIAPEPDPLESWHQEQLLRMCALNVCDHPELADIYAVPNGGFRHKATAAAMKRQGVVSGIPDLALDHARGSWFGLKIEMKRFRTGEISDEQKDRLLRLRAAGYRAVVCWGWREAWAEILRYLSLPPTVPTVTPPAYTPFGPRPGSRAAKQVPQNQSV